MSFIENSNRRVFFVSFVREEDMAFHFMEFLIRGHDGDVTIELFIRELVELVSQSAIGHLHGLILDFLEMNDFHVKGIVVLSLNRGRVLVTEGINSTLEFVVPKCELSVSFLCPP
jgi:hypothetical protein